MNHSSSDRLAVSLRRHLAQLAPGTRLPATRALAAQHGVGPGTVQAALRTLTAEGRVETRPGDGTFVARQRATAPEDFSWQTSALGPSPAGHLHRGTVLVDGAADAMDLGEGYPDQELYPSALIRQALTRAARSEAALTRAPVAGLSSLRRWFAQDLASRIPAAQPAPGERDVVILPGSQAGLSAIFRAVVGTGNALLVESPTYWGAMLAAAQVGVRLIPVASGPHGPDPEAVDAAFASSGAHAFYAQPTFSNPHGAVWDEPRRAAMLEVARAHGAFIVEDEWARDFALMDTPAPLAAQDPDGRVVHLRSLTKSVSPALRVAAVTARGPVRDRLVGEIAAQAMYVSPLLQAALLDVVTAAGWPAHLKRLRRELTQRRDLLLRLLAPAAPALTVESVPRGGLHAWVRVDPLVDAAELVARCLARGVRVRTGEAWFPAEPPAQFLRVTFAGVSAQSLPDAAGILAQEARQLWAERKETGGIGR
ncbi:aminotransferase-like domain-containing protein [Galactobacter caseinivorans]|uniref:PLP-dependent aminotransferase family protein n=1 Tax=Galactobacter caseinivorans TaxID=2676123 RepID=A0A496PJM6_9MICC|nr:PLP-dependent aminotransferase family protein [Galactobacter caseinivorans]RKW70702.1 PLP-dependent aminotransferase family protein [Galactobacter caseinivorans]